MADGCSRRSGLAVRVARHRKRERRRADAEGWGEDGRLIYEQGPGKVGVGRSSFHLCTYDSTYPTASGQSHVACSVLTRSGRGNKTLTCRNYLGK